MWDWIKLGNIANILEEKWRGQSAANRDLKVIYYENAVRILSGNYTQSKKITQENLTEGYWYYQANAAELDSEAPQILILGFGGGTIGAFLKQKYPDSRIDGVEIDPKMIELGERFLGLRKEDFNIVIGDAKEFVSQNKRKYDYICIDLYIEDVMPEVIEMKEFYQQLTKSLKKEGKVSVNRIFDLKTKEGEEAYANYFELMRTVFSQAIVIPVPNHFISKNYIFVGEK